MGILNRQHHRDVIFLTPVRKTGEKLPRSQVRMLYTDADGKVYSSVVKRSLYERARKDTSEMAQHRKNFATVGLEVSPGQFVPRTVEIGSKELWALEHIMDHALKSGMLPDVLKGYLKPIIQIDEDSREAIIAAQTGRRRVTTSPGVLDRLPYYSESDIEFSMPIYKAGYRYPLIVLKNLESGRPSPQQPRSLLILDSDGDLGVIKAPPQLADHHARGSSSGKKASPEKVKLITRQPEGLAADYMEISQQQRKALDTLVRYFEETGAGKQPLSSSARKVIDQARDRVSIPMH